MSDSIFRAKHLKKTYKVRSASISGESKIVHAINDVSFEIERGKSMGLVGESGCGKSTVAKTILNLIPLDSGSIYLEEQCLYDSKAKIVLKNKEWEKLRKRMQIVFQDPSSCMDPKKNVEQILMAGIKKHQICEKSDMKDYCIEMLEKCGLNRSLMMRYPYELSGGQKQRVAIARSFALKPEFVVCDEITASLDVSVQSQILNLLLDLKEKMNVTYLFISHNLEVVKYFCDDIMIMQKGEIVERGKCMDVYANPSHKYTKLLLKSIPAETPQSAGRIF